MTINKINNKFHKFATFACICVCGKKMGEKT